MFRQLAISMATLVALSHSHWVSAAPWYEVEVYVFERTSATTEQWPDDVKLPNTAKAIDLISPIIGSETVLREGVICESADIIAQTCVEQMQVVDKTYPQSVPVDIAAQSVPTPNKDDSAVLAAQSQNRFSDIIQSLRREPATRGLLHMTWQQPMQPRHKAMPIRVFAGVNFANEFEANGVVRQYNEPTIEIAQPVDAPASEYAALTAANDVENNLPAPTVLPVWQLDGTINIYLSHYLYIETNLGLRVPGQKTLPLGDVTTAAGANEVSASVTDFLYAVGLNQNRRVRSGEIHYFDHPRMGIVMQIRKMQQPQGEAEPTDVPEETEDTTEEQVEPDEPLTTTGQ